MKRARVLWLSAALIALAMAIPAGLRVLRAETLPQVQLNADAIGPRSIEELTGRNITRDYAYAWRDLSQALGQNQKALLNDYFTGFAKDDFSQRIADQARLGLRTRYVDHGHKVKAFFYSIDGSAMQLLDQAQIEIQVLDGSKVIHQENATQDYLVLMTPGADRWFVRSLEPIAKSN